MERQRSSSIFLRMGVKFDTWDDFFAYIIKKSEKEKLALVVDEFQRFLQVSPDFITKLQRYWDESLKYNKIMIIIVGSSIGMMEKMGKSYASPLYGRVTNRTKISPFRYADTREMFKSMGEEDRIRYYAVFGGTPYYLAEAKNAGETLEQCIVNLMLLQGGKFFDEPAVLMESEKIRTHARYNSILQAISAGKEITRELEDFTMRLHEEMHRKDGSDGLRIPRSGGCGEAVRRSAIDTAAFLRHWSAGIL